MQYLATFMCLMHITSVAWSLKISLNYSLYGQIYCPYEGNWCISIKTFSLQKGEFMKMNCTLISFLRTLRDHSNKVCNEPEVVKTFVSDIKAVKEFWDSYINVDHDKWFTILYESIDQKDERVLDLTLNSIKDGYRRIISLLTKHLIFTYYEIDGKEEWYFDFTNGFSSKEDATRYLSDIGRNLVTTRIIEKNNMFFVIVQSYPESRNLACIHGKPVDDKRYFSKFFNWRFSEYMTTPFKYDENVPTPELSESFLVVYGNDNEYREQSCFFPQFISAYKEFDKLSDSYKNLRIHKYISDNNSIYFEYSTVCEIDNKKFITHDEYINYESHISAHKLRKELDFIVEKGGSAIKELMMIMNNQKYDSSKITDFIKLLKNDSKYLENTENFLALN